MLDLTYARWTGGLSENHKSVSMYTILYANGRHICFPAYKQGAECGLSSFRK